MSIALVAWGRFWDPENKGGKITVPAPNTNPGKPWLYDFLATNAAEIGKHFDIVQLPPSSMALGGNGAGCDGYGVQHRRNLGRLSQETRYGTGAKLRRAIACLNRYGVQSYLDIVLHQLMGENGGPGYFRYPGADGKTMNGRGSTTPGWFRGNTGNNDPVPPFCNEDDVPDKFYDYPFGRELSYQNCNPHRVTIEDALDYGDWLFRTTGATGARYDDVKGTWAPAVAEFMNSRAMRSKTFYSEYFEGNPATLNWWANGWPMNGRSGVEDFTNHWAIQSACHGSNARVLNSAGYTSWNADQSYVFVDNPDTDLSGGQSVIFAKLLGYAFLATIPSKCFLVYGKDYFNNDVWEGAYGLKPFIDPLLHVNRTFAFGKTNTEYLDDKAIVLSRNGDGGSVGKSAGLLTALNFDTYHKRQITCHTPFGPHQHLHDYVGHHPDIWTDDGENATFTIPANAYNSGQSYCCFSVADADRPYVVQPQSTTQTFFGAEDLLNGPAKPNAITHVEDIYADEKHPITLVPEGDHEGLEFFTQKISFGGTNPSGIGIAKPSETHWYSISVKNTTPTAKPYIVKATYTAPQSLTADDQATWR